MSQRSSGSVALHLRLPRWALLIVATVSSGFSSPRESAARQQVLALSGDPQPSGGGMLRSVSAAAINNQGSVAFLATLADGVGGVDSTNDVALWRIVGGSYASIARKGMGDLSGASFGAFSSLSIADDGDVVIRAATTQNKQGLWRLPLVGGTSLITMTDGGPVAGPGLNNAKFLSLGFPLFHSASDTVAYSGRLVASPPQVMTSTARGAWLDVNGVGSIIARERTTAVPDAVNAQFFLPTAEGVNGSGATALLASLVIGAGGVSTNSDLGIWRMSSSESKLIARRGSVAAGTLDSNYYGLSDARINSAGQMAFAGELELAGSVSTENHRGIWRFDGENNSLVARTGDGASGVNNALFATLDAPLLNDAGQVLFSGTMKPGVGGVFGATARGVWIAGVNGSNLVARSGVGGVPGLPTARFAEFGGLGFNGDGVAAMMATLETGTGGVAAGNEQGIWLMDASGDGRLIARAGDSVAGRTIASVEFTAGSGGGDGRQRSLNEKGQLVYKATFTNGDEGLLLHTPDLKWRAAGSGAWDASTNWTLGITPADVHEVDLSPHAALTVVGPTADATVKKLTLGAGSGVATLELAAGSELTVTEGLHLAANGRLAGKGTLVGEVINSGATSPGTSIGVLAITGDYVQQTAGRLSIELGGVDNSSPLAPEYDQLLISGRATLAGTLDVSLVGGFVPAIGDTFEILRATGGLTAFDAFELPALPSDRKWMTTPSVDALALSVVAAAPSFRGDLDNDGDVDRADLQVWKNSLAAANMAGDANGDGVVNGNDFLVWQRDYSQHHQAHAGVPEPAVGPLAGLAIAAIATFARKNLRLRRRQNTNSAADST